MKADTISPLEAVKCNGCNGEACYVRGDDIEDIPDPVYCVKCVVIQPKTKVTDGLSREDKA